MTRTLDELMDLDPLSLTKTDLDDIIAYHRERRAKNAGEGPKSRAKKAEGPGADLSAVVKSLIGDRKVENVIKRRI